jgi:hypothetical protein
MATLRVDPKLVAYGDSFGTYAGNQLGDTDIYSTAIDSSLLNMGTLADHVDFSCYEKTIRDFILARLGHPIVRVELTDFQIKTAIDEAITNLDYHAPFWATQMAVFQTSGTVNSYVLPSHIANNLAYVSYKKSLLTIQPQAGSIEFDFFIKYFQDSFVFSNFAVSDFYLLQSHMEMVRKVLSQEGTWDLINGNVLQLYPPPVGYGEEVILVYRALDSGTMHPYYKNWIQRFALAVAKGILGEIRGKYSSLPSPGGGRRKRKNYLKSNFLQR